MNFKLFALVILSVASVALAGPTTAGNKIDTTKDFAETIKTPAIQTLKQWCQASKLSQPELTESFKRLVSQLKQSPTDELTEAAISGHLCQANEESDMNANDLVKDVYMDAIAACEDRECMKQLIKCIDSGKVDKVRANYYMTRLAVNDNTAVSGQKEMIQELSDSFVPSEGQQQSLADKAIQRQKMFAVTANLAKLIEKEMQSGQKWEQSELKQTVERVVRAINDRFVKPVTQQDVDEYKQKSKTPAQLAEKIAERNAALKAMNNIPGHILAHIEDVHETLVQLVKNKQELSTVRQSAIEALEQNEKVTELMAEIALQQHDEPTEVRIAAYRCLMTTFFAGSQEESKKQQEANEIIVKVLKHVEGQQNQQQDEQFCLYVISHLENLRTSDNPNHVAIKECIQANKQHHMQISLLSRKFAHKLQKFGKSSRNYQIDQTFDKLESGLIVEGDLIFGQEQQQTSFLPKLVRVNVSLPLMGTTVNVVELAIRQDNMEKEFINALRPLQDAKFNTETIEKVVGEFKQQVQQQQQQRDQSGMRHGASEADIAIKVDNCYVIYLCADDLKFAPEVHSRQTRSIRSTSAFEDILEQLKRNQLSFNRGFHFDINKRIAGVLDLEAHLIGGLILDSRINTHRGAQDYEVQISMEPRVAFEALVGPSASSKRLLQRSSTKSAIGMRLRYKQDELVDVQIDLPMEEMELFKFETQMVEKDFQSSKQQMFNKYNYLKDSVYGSEDIYAPEEHFSNSYSNKNKHQMNNYRQYESSTDDLKDLSKSGMKRWRQMKNAYGSKSAWNKHAWNKQALFWQKETSSLVAQATGLRSKLTVIASPKDMTFLASCIVKKDEPSMQGFRVQVQQQKSSDNQYIVTLSTPGSRVDRTMQLRLTQQSSAQNTVLKTELQSRLMSGNAQIELIHDGRQYAIKVETATSRRTASTYKFEAGIQRSSQSGKIATTYKPYLLVQAPELVRPIQMQGLISYQQSPKTVITYELKSQNSDKFIQGKYILQTRASSQSAIKRAQWNRRSMQSPIELMLQDDITMTNEITAQWKDFALKQNIMIESEGSQLTFDIANQYKTKRTHKPEESRLTVRANYGQERRSVHVEHRCSLFPAHNFRFDSQFDAIKKVAVAKYASKDTNAQIVFDLQSKKAEIVVDNEGRRVAAVQTRFNRQGEQYHFDAVAQFKNQPWAKISGKCPASLLEEPTRFFQNVDRASYATIEFDGIVYKTQDQFSGKLDLQKNELFMSYKSRDQTQGELKARFDENVATLFADYYYKQMNKDLKTQVKINMPGLIETITFGKASWKKTSWVPSWMVQGKIDSSEITFQSRDAQLRAKLIPRDELSLVIRSQKLQHESRLNLRQSMVFKLKSETVLLHSRRQCNIDIELDAQQQHAIIKANTKQSQCQIVANWPQKKIDLVLDVDGVRVISHQARFENTDKFLNFNTNVDYYQKPYLSLSGQVPRNFHQSSYWFPRGSQETSEINFGSKLTQMKFKVVPGNKIQAFIKNAEHQHEAHLDMQDGLTLNVNSQVQSGKLNYNLQVEVSEQNKRTVVELNNKRTAIRLVVDLMQNKIDLIAECDGRQIISTQNNFVRRGEFYKFDIFAQYWGQPLAKIQGEIPAMLVESPIEFLKNIDRLHAPVMQFSGVVYQKSTPAQVTGKLDFQKNEMFVTYKSDREHGTLKAKFDENSANLLVEAFLKSADVKVNAKINMPGLIETIAPSSSWNKQWWAVKRGQVEQSEIVYQTRDVQMMAKLIPRDELTVVVTGDKIQHQSRLDLNKSDKVFKLKTETYMNKNRHCEAEVEIDAEQKVFIVKANYKKTAMEFVFDLPQQKLNLYVEADGRRVVSHQARLVREGSYYTVNSHVEYQQQPFAHIQAKIPAMLIERPWEILECREEAEIKYESRYTQVKVHYTPKGELVVYAKTPSTLHQSRVEQVSQGAYKLNASQQWQDGTEYDIEAELDKPQQKSSFKAFNKPTGQYFADWSWNKGAALLAY